MTQFRFNIGDVVEYIDGTNKLWLGTRHRVTNRKLNRFGEPEIRVSFIDGKPNMTPGLWHRESLFRLIAEASTPADRPDGRDRARELLNQAETKHNQGEGYHRVQTLAVLGILHALLAEPERVTDTTGHEITPRDMARQIDELQTVRRALQTRVDELSEKTDILDAELAVAQGRERRIRTENQDLRVAVSGLKAEKREALEEVARLNRLLGIVPTRLEAVSDVEGFTVTENGNSVEIFDGEDTVTFERPIGDADDSFIFVSPLPEDGVYITRAQWDALTRQGEIWAEDRDA